MSHPYQSPKGPFNCGNDHLIQRLSSWRDLLGERCLWVFLAASDYIPASHKASGSCLESWDLVVSKGLGAPEDTHTHTQNTWERGRRQKDCLPSTLADKFVNISFCSWSDSAVTQFLSRHQISSSETPLPFVKLKTEVSWETQEFLIPLVNDSCNDLKGLARARSGHGEQLEVELEQSIIVQLLRKTKGALYVKIHCRG